MINLHKQAMTLREQLTKEVSGFVVLFGQAVDRNSAQQLDAVAEHFESQSVSHIDLEKSFPSLSGELTTNGGLKRLTANESHPERLLALSHTWSKTGELTLDDLLLIHGAFEEELSKKLNRN